MDLQLIEAYVPKRHFEKVDQSLQDLSHVSYWSTNESKERMLIRILVHTKHTEETLNFLEKVSNVIDGFEVMLIPVQTYITRKNEEKKEEEKKQKDKHFLRASRQELYETILRSSKINLNYTLLVILSALVVIVGFMKNSPAVVIGAMVIAPMLGPVISIAFASILGDYHVLWRSFLTLHFGIALVFFISLCFGYFYIPLDSTEFAARTQVDFTDVILALASGAAGALSILNRLPGALVGVMVAVALLPPIVVLGMTTGGLMWDKALGALLLLLVNINSILLSAIAVFSLSGIRPLKWEEMQRAYTSRRLSIFFVSLIILFLIIVITISQRLNLI
ncbi:TIGR00341 family protein [Bacillus taeanensis]|uniref:TIGR00341 family protein n=1 Tax=Bacillus taeanensis TaxID=273032 RepID=A0A366XXV8_9BACI|nr:TIGR00341 family protein [Bacillus taeanensis]RBW68973.1 TIGR00341 family protein [Bacillus taeanensis]